MGADTLDGLVDGGALLVNTPIGIEAFDNFISDHPGSVFRSEAFFGRFNAAYLLAIKSKPSKINERLIATKEYYNSFMKYYKDNELATEAIKIMRDIESRLTITETSS